MLYLAIATFAVQPDFHPERHTVYRMNQADTNTMQ